MNIDELTHKVGNKKIVNKSLDEHAFNCTFIKIMVQPTWEHNEIMVFIEAKTKEHIFTFNKVHSH